MDDLIRMQLEASYRQEVAHRWAERRSLLRLARRRQRPEARPAASRLARWRLVLRHLVTGWPWRHARRAAVRSSA